MSLIRECFVRQNAVGALLIRGELLLQMVQRDRETIQALNQIKQLLRVAVRVYLKPVQPPAGFLAIRKRAVYIIPNSPEVPLGRSLRRRRLLHAAAQRLNHQPPKVRLRRSIQLPGIRLRSHAKNYTLLRTIY